MALTRKTLQTLPREVSEELEWVEERTSMEGVRIIPLMSFFDREQKNGAEPGELGRLRGNCKLELTPCFRMPVTVHQRRKN